MRTKNFILISFLTGFLSQAYAQETPTLPLTQPKPVKKVDVCELYMNGGFMIQSSQFSNMADYSKLAPESKLLKVDLSSYSQTESFSTNTSGMFSVLMGMRFGEKDKSGYKPNPIFRAGFSYLNSANISNGLYKSGNKRYDTLVSNADGSEHYVDSVSQRRYDMSYNSQQIRIDLSLIFRTDGKARWSFYSGIGLNAGVSLNANTKIDYSNYAYTETDGKTYSSSNSQSKYPFSYYFYETPPPPADAKVTSNTETFRNENNSSFSAYIPLAVDFRIGKVKPFWKRTHLFIEFRPGVNSVNIPELGRFSSAYWQSNFGLKINWENM